MRANGPVQTDIVLLGAGHAHVEVLRRFAMRPEPGVRLTLIGREPMTPYSGMLPGLIRGDYSVEEAHIDLAPLAAAAGARLIMATATAIDLQAQAVAVTGRPEVAYDLLSIDVGGEPLMPPHGGTPVKPVGQFLARLQALEESLPDGARIAVVGGGAAGVELALALAARFQGRFRLMLIAAAPEPLASAPAHARRVARAALVDSRVELISGVTAGALEHGRLVLSDQTAIEADAALWATNVVGPGFLAASGLACDINGCIHVETTLRSISHPAVFAAGDCATVGGAPRPKAGVWAVRAGGPLADNLRRAAQGKPLQPWKPQGDALVILGLGYDRAVAWRNGLAVSGRLVWRLKDWIDRRWMRMYQHMSMPADPAEPMRCGGCGAKVGAEALAGALATLPVAYSPELVIGLDPPDDAAVLKPPPGQLIVQSVDHFRAFLDDPYVFGRVAAAHALSDLHAMGARPWSALAIATVPYAASAKMRDELSGMLRGASEILSNDGCMLVGGHSGEGAEAALGFAVTGLVEPRALLRKSGLKPGDQLVLTKPLGTGIILAAHMRGRARAVWLQAAIDSMCRSNGEAARLLRQHGATACTDVTGFGLAGHAQEMLRASQVSAVIWPNLVPALPGALALAGAGVASTLAPDNRRLLPGADGEPRTALLVDPQTSGGLLAGIPAHRIQACLNGLADAGYQAAVIGVVEAAEPDGPALRLYVA